MGQGHTRMELDSNHNETNHKKNDKNGGNAKESKDAKHAKHEKQTQEKKFTPDSNVSFDFDLGGNVNINKRKSSDKIDVLEKLTTNRDFGACGGMSFPQNSELGKGATQESNKQSQKKWLKSATDDLNAQSFLKLESNLWIWFNSKSEL